MPFSTPVRLAAAAVLTVVAGASAVTLSPGGCPASACTESNADRVMTGAMAPLDIVDTAVAAGDFETLVAAVKAAGLVDALKGDGPFTVFAPNDAAFAKLPDGTIPALLDDPATLAKVLTFHVVPGKIMARDVVRSSGAVTLEGQRLDFATKNGSVTVDGAKVIAADIEVANGVIHVIDQVVLPSSDSIVNIAASAGTFGTLLAAAEAAGLAEALAGPGPLTVFAPTDAAFAKLPAGTVEALLADPAKLAEILKYHVVSGRAYASDAARAGRVATLQGGEVVFSFRDGRMTVDGANIVATDIDAGNGVIHVIDSVILPN